MKYPVALTLLSGILTCLVLMYKKPELVVPSIFILIGFALSAYTVNCTITGKCSSWSWVLAICYTFYAANIIFLALNDKLDLQ